MPKTTDKPVVVEPEAPPAAPSDAETYRREREEQARERAETVRNLKTSDLIRNVDNYLSDRDPRLLLDEIACDQSRSLYLLTELRRVIVERRDAIDPKEMSVDSGNGSNWQEYERLSLLESSIQMHLDLAGDALSKFKWVFGPAIEWMNTDDDEEEGGRV